MYSNISVINTNFISGVSNVGGAIYITGGKNISSLNTTKGSNMLVN